MLFTNKYSIIRNWIITFLIEILSGFVLARIIVEWYMLARFNSQFSNLYNFLWQGSGYIVSSLMVLWIYDWQIKSYRKLDKTILAEKRPKLTGRFYTIEFIIYLVFSLLLFNFICLNLFYSINSNYQLSFVLSNSLQALYILISKKYIFLILISIIFFSQRFVYYINHFTNLVFIIIIGGLWKSHNLVEYNVNTSLVSESSQTELISVFILISTFVLLKLFLFLWSNHTSNNRLSDWSRERMTKHNRLQILSIFGILFVIFIFFLAIYF